MLCNGGFKFPSRSEQALVSDLFISQKCAGCFNRNDYHAIFHAAPARKVARGRLAHSVVEDPGPCWLRLYRPIPKKLTLVAHLGLGEPVQGFALKP